MRESLPELTTFKWTTPLPTRWSDNDIYGHMNNVVYYALFDTVANSFMIQEGEFDFRDSQVVAYVVQSDCQYASQLAFPDALVGGLSVDHLGSRSVRYKIGIFKKGGNTAAACGHFTHVFVDRESSKAVAIPTKIRQAFEAHLG